MNNALTITVNGTQHNWHVADRSSAETHEALQARIDELHRTIANLQSAQQKVVEDSRQAIIREQQEQSRLARQSEFKRVSAGAANRKYTNLFGWDALQETRFRSILGGGSSLVTREWLDKQYEQGLISSGEHDALLEAYDEA
jgi:hypothetical protein